MIICMIIASACFIVFAFLFLTAGEQNVRDMLVCCGETEMENIKKGQIELSLLVENMKHTKDMDNKQKIKQGKQIKKKIVESKKRLEAMKQGKIGILDLIPLAGYRFKDLYKLDASNDTVKKLNAKCCQFKEKKEALNYANYLLASLIGNILLGVCVGFAAMGIAFARNLGTRSIIVGVVGFGIFAILGYIPYDNVDAVVRQRKDEIETQFPQVISKMTLLVVAGMDITKAWNLTSGSGTGVLYEEMKRVIIDLDHNVSAKDAYSKFITRCNNNYTTKLATAIIQNNTKGNSEIVNLFRTLNSESWMEHKHNARRKGEQIQSKLLIPTLLMFLGIIVLIIVPIISGFNF